MSQEFKIRVLSSLILIPLSFFFIIKGSFFFNFFLLICFLITSYEWHAMSKNKNYNIIGFLFLIFSFYSAYNIRINFENNSLLIFLFVILTCISTDIGGYIFGNIFKGPKLTKISPKKTFSGMIGGYFLSVIIIYFYLKYSKLIGEHSYEITIKIFFVVLLISTISQIGDIIISFFKRLSKIKDTGKIIPGHGGILDRIDGMLFAIPFSNIFFSFNIII